MSIVKVDLEGKTAIVTGAGKGIGKEIAISLAESGAKIIAMSRTENDLQILQEEISSKGGECVVETCDISNVSQIQEKIAGLSEKVDRIDILVNSAGVNVTTNALDVTEEAWDKVLDTNLKGTFFMSQAVAKQMIKHKKGKIINITSQMAFVGYYKRSAYCASKGGLTQAAKALSVELAQYNINVNCIAPTFINTPLTKPMFEDEDFLNEVKSRSPLGRVGEPKDVTGAVLFLASDSSDLMTGSTVLVDGGWVAW